jgi:hypothetical protein
MTNIDDGGPAFPRPMVGSGSSNATSEQDGMSLRDWFAGQALQGMFAHVAGNHVDEMADGAIRKPFHKAAYAMADLMLEARKE